MQIEACRSFFIIVLFWFFSGYFPGLSSISVVTHLPALNLLSEFSVQVKADLDLIILQRVVNSNLFTVLGSFMALSYFLYSYLTKLDLYQPSNFENDSTPLGVEHGPTGSSKAGRHTFSFFFSNFDSGDFNTLWPTDTKFLALKHLNLLRIILNIKRIAAISG